MFCEKCGAQVPDNCTFCTMCGHNVRQSAQPQQVATQPYGEPAPAAASGSVLSFLMGIFKDNLFLTVCILLSVSVGAALCSGNIPLINGLVLIFLWIVYAQSRKNLVDVAKMRCVSGTVYANLIVSYVACGIIGVCGIILMLLGDVGEDLFDLVDNLDMEMFAFVAGDFMRLMGFVMLLVAAIVFVLAYFSWNKIHKFVQSVYKSAEADCFMIVNWETAKTWLMVLGVLAAIGSLSGESFLEVASGGCEAAALIVGSVLVNKHFSRLGR